MSPSSSHSINRECCFLDLGCSTGPALKDPNNGLKLNVSTQSLASLLQERERERGREPQKLTRTEAINQTNKRNKPINHRFKEALDPVLDRSWALPSSAGCTTSSGPIPSKTTAPSATPSATPCATAGTGAPSSACTPRRGTPRPCCRSETTGGETKGRPWCRGGEKVEGACCRWV